METVLVQGRTLKGLAPRTGLTPQALGHRFRQVLRKLVSQPRTLRLPAGPLVLVCDGVYFRFRGRHWVLYLMAVKPCHHNRAMFLDPVLLSGRENLRGWYQAIATIPAYVHKRIRASVSDEVAGIVRLGTSQGWIVQLCHFHLISRLQNCRGRRNRRLAGRALREALYQLTRQALELPDGPQLHNVLNELRSLVGQATGLRVIRMIVREFLRRIDHFRAYRKYPELGLPATTGSVEAMGRKVRDLMPQTRSIRSPQALQLWATAMIRMRPTVKCNGKHFQQNFFV
ncbi:MAG TPA: hypothetical protein VE689_10120 [Candidatus Udaeobacter sp.]|nr:hypothetical protein [Candidatus Udaeobacter sp.]